MGSLRRGRRRYRGPVARLLLPTAVAVVLAFVCAPLRRGSSSVQAFVPRGLPTALGTGGPRVARSERLSLHAEASSTSQEAKLSSARQSTVNLVKNIVGSGMLSLPAGVAAFSDSSVAVLPAASFAMLLAVISAYGFVLIADACKRTGESTYQGAWGKTVSPSTSWIPAAACSAKAAIGCISFSMILGDCLSLVLAPLGLPAAVSSRSAVILGLTAVVLLPLCSMESLAPLAKFSVLGVLSNVYICAFVLLRCLDGSYAAGGPLAQAAPALPQFSAAPDGGAWSLVLDPGFTVLLSILATAFLAHYNAPTFYEQLAPDQNGDKDRPFLVVSVLGFGAAAAIMSLVMCGGFLTFGRSSLGLILNNYAATDGLAVLARLAIAISLITAYPLVFFSLRRQFVALLGDSGEKIAAESPRALTVGLLGLVTAVALNLQNLGKLATFAGAVFGSLLIYIGPALMSLGAQRRGLGPRGGYLGRVAQALMIPLGIGLGALGAAQTLK